MSDPTPDKWPAWSSVPVGCAGIAVLGGILAGLICGVLLGAVCK